MSRTATSLPRLRLNGIDDGDGGDGLDSAGLEQKYLGNPPWRDSSDHGEEAYQVNSGSAGAGGVTYKDHMQMATRGDEATTTTATSASSPPGSSSHVNPATVPIRTSSSKAVNGEKEKSSSSPKKSPRKHRSMASVPEERRHLPEVDERHWLAQSKQQNRHDLPITSFPQPPTTTASSSSPAPPTSQPSSGTDPLRGGIGADLISGQPPSWSAEKENILRGPFEYLESHPGKDIRSQLITAFNAWLQVPTSSLRIITDVIAMLHTASLLVDDVEDGSQLRRGIPVAHAIFGTAQTINSANYMYFCAMQELFKLNNPDAMRIFTEELLNLHRGQGMDLFWRDTLTCPTEDDYLEMVGNKTGGLFRLAIKLMCAESPAHHFSPASTSTSPNQPQSQKADYIPLVNTIGLLFQILDDYKNLNSTLYTANKGLCEDLTEGKFSFPIIHAIRADPKNLVLINILKQKTTDDEVKKFAVAYMERMGSFAYTRRVMRGLNRKAGMLVEEVDLGRGRAEGVKGVLERLRVEKHERGSSSA